MKVVIITGGSRGDVAPYTGLGARLKAAGHDVAIAAQESFAGLVHEAGCEFRLVPGDTRAMLGSEEGQRWQGRGTGTLRAMKTNIQMGMRLLEETGKGVVSAAQGADVLLLHRTALWHGYLAAGAMGIPAVGLELFPSVPTADFALPSFDVRFLGRWGNRHLPRLLMGVTSHVRTPLDAPIRAFQQQLGLPQTGLSEVRGRTVEDENWTILHGYSPQVVPRPVDWRPGVEVVGYWWPPAREDWRPPRELTDFLEAGPPPVFVGFGSITRHDTEKLAETISAAMRRAGTRAVVQAGWSELSAMGDDVLAIGDTPHEWLFPRMAAVVHHAGAGTAGAGVRAGVPAVPVPMMGDAPFWSRRLAGLGVSPGYVPMNELSAERLGDLVRQAVTDPVYRQRAAELARRVGAEDGPARVIETLDRLPRRPRRR
ncbi:glycosyltransferase [Nonomuraea sp. NPDC052129]|uniref:glycosyltransferase n=1 Tax=Nonomuraea sp. NPDC052129 TaxID=3154651 RepID=UPI00343D9D7E